MKFEIETLNKVFDGASLTQIAFSKANVKFHFDGNENFQIKIERLSNLIIEPKSFDCPSGMSMHTQVLWLVDEAFQFIGNKVLDLKIIENNLLALQFENGALAFKIDDIEITY